MPDPITVYWRPGCGFCMALRRGLDAAEVTYDAVNIWEDPAGADFVRSVNDGNELVPTVRVGDAVMANPRVDEVMAVAAAQA